MLFGNLSFTEYILSLSRLRRILHRLDGLYNKYILQFAKQQGPISTLHDILG